MKELLNQKKKEETKEIRSFRKQMRCESKNFKNSFESNLRTLDDNSSKEKDFSIKIDQDKKKNDKKREESLEKLQNILFIRENKKKNHEEEIKNNVIYILYEDKIIKLIRQKSI